jgi:SAM-dependent methyltransferase
MHPTVMTFVNGWLDKLGGTLNKWTLDVGSWDVNGSIRPFLHGPYVGIDIRKGPNVSIEGDASWLPFSDNSFDRVVSTEMLEHDRYPWLSVAEMARVCKKGGYVLITCRGYDETGCTPIHDYPADYWRYSQEAVCFLMHAAGLMLVEVLPDSCGMQGVLAVGSKPN